MIRRPPRSTLFPTRRSSDLDGIRRQGQVAIPFLQSRQARTDRETFALLRRRLPCIRRDRKSTRLNSSHSQISYAVFCLKKKKKKNNSILTQEANAHD